MKKLYLLFSCMLCTVFLLAQPTLQYPNNVPQISDVVQIQFVSADGISTGPSGADVSWDYSNLTGTFGGQITAIDPSQAPAGNDFPEATVVLSMGDTLFTYTQTSADGYFYLGSQSTTGTFPSLLIYSDSRTFIKFPFTYLDTYFDVYKGVVTTTVASVHSSAVTEILADAYGTLTLPTGTYTNVLRTVTVDAEIDSVFAGGIFVKAFDIVRTQFSWFKGDSKNPLMSIEILNNTYVGTIDTIAYYITGGSGIGDGTNTPVSSLSIFPNPADDHLMVEYTVAIGTSTSISIANQVGQIMVKTPLSENITSKVSERIDISTLPAGLYFVNVTCNCGKQVTAKFVIR